MTEYQKDYILNYIQESGGQTTEVAINIFIVLGTKTIIQHFLTFRYEALHQKEQQLFQGNVGEHK